MHYEHHVVIGNLIPGRGIVEEVDKALHNVKTTNSDIGILFDGQSLLSGVWFSDRLKELLKGGRVKAIRAGYHFEEEATIQSVHRIDSGMACLSFEVIYTFLNVMYNVWKLHLHIW
jgi:hypothetical protein